MERKLQDAAMEGNVSSLQELLQQDPLILDRLIVSCTLETPLHIASMLGYFNFVKHLLSQKPELASELDSNGCSSLHLAAAKGNLEIVKELLVVDPQMGKVRNHDGRTPLHAAAIKGRVKVVNELVRVDPESMWVLTDRGETVLHLCVESNKLEVLNVLIAEIRQDEKLANWKDYNGNTVLHIAVAKKQVQIIKSLLTVTGLEVNATNSIGLTAFDILIQSPRNLRDMEIQESLRKTGGVSAKDLPLITEQEWGGLTRVIANSISSPHQENDPKKPVVKGKNIDWLGRKRSALMVVASLIATVAFQGAISPPGGVWGDDLQVDANGNPVDKPHAAGTSIMAYNHEAEYGQFMIFNTIAFLSSLSIILLLVSGLPIKRRRWMWIQMVTMWIAITALVLTYFISLSHMSPDSVHSTLHDVTQISVLAWLCLMGVVFIGNIVRLNLWVLSKYGCIKENETVASVSIEDDQEEEV